MIYRQEKFKRIILNLAMKKTPLVAENLIKYFINCFLLGVFIQLIIALSPQQSCSAIQEISGLRQGRIHIKTEGINDQLTVQYTPIYGWDEPLLFFGPDARLIKKIFLGHMKSGNLTLKIDQGPGHYVLILKPSYLWNVTLNQGEMVYQPPVEESGIRKSFDDNLLFFKVPDGTPHFTFYWTNHRSYKGQAARVQLLEPKGHVVADKSLPKVDIKKALKILQSQDVDMSEFNTTSGAGNFNPPFNPMPPDKIRIDSPQAGIWQVSIGTIGNLSPDNVGFWLEGIPSYFSSAVESLNTGNEKFWTPSPQSESIPAAITVLDKALPTPMLGVVGHFGRKDGLQEKKMTDYGIQAEKVFLFHGNEESQNDNEYPDKLKLSAFNFNDQKNLFPRLDKFSLIVLDRWAGWIKMLSSETQALEWGEWAGAAVENMITVKRMNPDNMAVQFLNEANLKLRLNEYIHLLKAAGVKIKSNPKTRNCPIAVPAVATGLSKYKQQDHSLLDTRWIELVLEEADTLVDKIVFNVYEVSELEDTFLYAKLIDEVNLIIKNSNSDGVVEPIIIGATNRRGGLVSNRLFNDWEGAVWWASVLTQVINTGQIKTINYFNIVDKGIRQKGLFTASHQPKNQAVIQQLFARALSKGKVLETRTNHFGLEAISVETQNGITMILVNKSWRNINASIETSFDSIGNLVRYEAMHPQSLKSQKGKPVLNLPPQTVTLLELH